MDGLNSIKNGHEKSGINPDAYLDQPITSQQIPNLRDPSSGQITSQGKAEHKDRNHCRDRMGCVSKNQRQHAAPHHFVDQPAEAGEEEDRDQYPETLLPLT
jgi:hypothetical protein